MVAIQEWGIIADVTEGGNVAHHDALENRSSSSGPNVRFRARISNCPRVGIGVADTTDRTGRGRSAGGVFTIRDEEATCESRAFIRRGATIEA